MRIWGNPMLTINTKRQEYRACSVLCSMAACCGLSILANIAGSPSLIRATSRGIWESRCKIVYQTYKNVLDQASIPSKFAVLTQTNGEFPSCISFSPLVPDLQGCRREINTGNIDPAGCETEYRNDWRRTVNAYVQGSEEIRELQSEERRKRRWQEADSLLSEAAATFTCDNCNRAWRSRIVLHSHSRRNSSTTKWIELSSFSHYVCPCFRTKRDVLLSGLVSPVTSLRKFFIYFLRKRFFFFYCDLRWNK